jgi:1,4-alpha-glucan branching enzyme
MYAQPGKKLMFMGGEFGQVREWAHDSSLDWHLLQYPVHRGLQRSVEQLNFIYQQHPGLHELDTDPAGFEWIDCNDSENSIISLLRKGKSAQDEVVVVCNFTPVPRVGYRLGVPSGGCWRELLNSDAKEYGGSGMGNPEGVQAAERRSMDAPTHSNSPCLRWECSFSKPNSVKTLGSHPQITQITAARSHYLPSCFFAASTIRSGSNPNFLCNSLSGADAPNVFMPIT